MATEAEVQAERERIAALRVELANEKQRMETAVAGGSTDAELAALQAESARLEAVVAEARADADHQAGVGPGGPSAQAPPAAPPSPLTPPAPPAPVPPAPADKKE